MTAHVNVVSDVVNATGFEECVVDPNNTQDTVAHASMTIDSKQPARCSPLPKVVAVTVSGPLGSVNTYALLDDGATSTFIESDTCSRIGVSGPTAQIRLDCVGGLSTDTTVHYVDFNIKGRHEASVHRVHKARSINHLGIKTQSVGKDHISKFTYLSDLVDVLFYENAKPTIILRIDNWHLTIARDIRKGTKSQPVAINTVLGWVLFGFSSSRTRKVDVVHHTSDMEVESSDNSLETLIKEQYKLEAIGITKREIRSANDEHAIKVLENTTRRMSSGRFEVGLLWRPDIPTVPNSYLLALSSFLSLERKMNTDSSYAELYRRNIHGMFDKDYAELCPVQDTTEQSVNWYLPHFGVTHSQKPGKLRIVHDAAAKCQGISLNSMLVPGPDLLQLLLGILFRFREKKVALNADIREMFPQVKIRLEDRDAQRFLWRDSPNEPIKIYRMSSMVFSAASSPCSALFVKNKNANEFRDQYPRAADAIINDHYMDDYIGSVDSVEEAQRLAVDIVAVHKHADFEMRGWVSNNPETLSLLPKELLLTPSVEEIKLGDFPTSVRTLGLIWQLDGDFITFNELNINIKLENLTKRVVLSYIMRVYDPLGILAPVIVPGRIMFQRVWRKGYDWDEKLPEFEQKAWKSWFDILTMVSNIRVPRLYYFGISEFVECELHIFADASESAYVAVAYWRFLYDNGKVKLSLICSKARVAPLKPISIPRLELQGALLAARLASSITESHSYIPSRRYFWSDSLNVLGWLRSDARSYKPFVAHRVGEILDLTNVEEWRWVPTDLNVADDATRLKCNVLSEDSRWVTGPHFLLINDWPAEPASRTTSLQEELKASTSSSRTCGNIVAAITDHVSSHDPLTSQSLQNIESQRLRLPLCADPTRSSWLTLVRATARAHKFIVSIRSRALLKKGCQRTLLSRQLDR